MVIKMILSLDASLSSTGYCVMKKESDTIIDMGKITTKPKQEEQDRIFYTCSIVRELVVRYGITDVVIEAQFLQRNPKTTMQLSRLRGALDFVLMDLGCKIEHLGPSTVRKLMMNNGNAGKEEVAEYIQDKYREDEKVINLGEFCDRNCKAKNSDIFDAIAIALAFKHII